MAMEKVVVRFEFKDDHSRRKALTLIVNTKGIDSVALVRPHRNAIEMGGVGVNWVRLLGRLAKKIGPTHLVIEGDGDGDDDGAGSSRGGGGHGRGGGGGGRGHGDQCVIL